MEDVEEGEERKEGREEGEEGACAAEFEALSLTLHNSALNTK